MIPDRYKKDYLQTYDVVVKDVNNKFEEKIKLGPWSPQSKESKGRT